MEPDGVVYANMTRDEKRVFLHETILPALIFPQNQIQLKSILSQEDFMKYFASEFHQEWHEYIDVLEELVQKRTALFEQGKCIRDVNQLLEATNSLLLLSQYLDHTCKYIATLYRLQEEDEEEEDDDNENYENQESGYYQVDHLTVPSVNEHDDSAGNDEEPEPIIIHYKGAGGTIGSPGLCPNMDSK
jgi:hypothetical protein